VALKTVLLVDGVGLLPKPFTGDELMQKIRQLLES